MIKRLGRKLKINRIQFLRNLYDKYLELKLPDRETFVSIDGHKMLIWNPKRVGMGKSIYLSGMWEPQVTEYISQKIEKGMTVLDIGADIGYYTLLFAKRVSKNGRVIAFEPIPSAREKLLQNVKMNGYKHITVCDFALFSSNGSATLEGPLKISRIAPKREKKLKNDIEVQTRIFDECLQDLRINRIDIVKIDVEGAELDVLHGMKLSLSKYQPSVLVEIHPEGLKTFGYTSSDLFEFMESMGYRPHPISGTSDYPERETHVFFYKDFRYKNPV